MLISALFLFYETYFSCRSLDFAFFELQAIDVEPIRNQKFGSFKRELPEKVSLINPLGIRLCKRPASVGALLIANAPRFT